MANPEKAPRSNNPGFHYNSRPDRIGSSYAEAKRNGLKFYRGVKCADGHRLRYTSNNTCVSCGRKRRVRPTRKVFGETSKDISGKLLAERLQEQAELKADIGEVWDED